jgi:hypothetical protein
MPFQLYVQPKMGEYMLSAAQSIAGNIQQARKKKEETEQKLGESDILLDYAKKHNLVSPEEESKYFGASADQKVGMADAWSKTIALNQAQELQASRLAQELQISQASQANQMAIAGMGLQGVGQPLYYPGAPQTRENLLGFKGRYGSVDYLPQGAGGIPTRTAGGAKISADNLEEYTIPDAQGKPTKNTVVRTKDTKEIVPNNLIQGVVRPDPMTTLLMENLTRQQQQTQQPSGFQKLVDYFTKPSTAAAATPAPTAAPGPAAAGAVAPPKIGDVVQGYKFKGGDPADPKNWEQVQ